MASMKTLEAQHRCILEELADLSDMRRGSICEQFVETTGRDGSKRRRGPYCVYTYKEKGKTVSRRLSTGLLLDMSQDSIINNRHIRSSKSEVQRGHDEHVE